MLLYSDSSYVVKGFTQVDGAGEPAGVACDNWRNTAPIANLASGSA